MTQLCLSCTFPNGGLPAASKAHHPKRLFFFPELFCQQKSAKQHPIDDQ